MRVMRLEHTQGQRAYEVAAAEGGAACKADLDPAYSMHQSNRPFTQL